jgi:hypothetical protein
MGDKRGANRDLEGRPQGKTALGRPRRRWNNHMKMNLPKSGM